MNRKTKSILKNKVNLTYVAPRSEATIPVLSTEPVSPKEEKINNIIDTLKGVATLADSVEQLVAERAKNESLKLNLNNPDDAVVAQAAGRLFPEKAKDLSGFLVVDEITFDMYNECLKSMKAAGLAAGNRQQMSQREPLDPKKTNFGGQGRDKRPDSNFAMIPFAPLNIPAFIAAGIPILFGMLYPLINGAIKKDIIGHTHLATAPGAPTSPGVPLIPV